MIITSVILIIIIIILVIYLLFTNFKDSILTDSVKNIISAVNVNSDPEIDMKKVLEKDRKYSVDNITNLQIEANDKNMLLKLFKIYISSNIDNELAILEKKGIIVIKDIKIYKVSFTKIFFDKNSNNILITFRGTTTKEDLINIDLKNKAKLFNLNNEQYYIHEGFGNILSILSINILNILKTIKFNKIILFGHSMGGSLAFLAPLFLQNYSKSILVYSSAFPTFGEKKILDYLDKNIVSYLGLINRYDYIPYIIPLFFKIDSHNAIAADIPKNLIIFNKNIGSINNHNMLIYMDYLLSN